MNLNHWHRVACLALLLPVLAASGCTGTDVLTPTTGRVSLELDVNNVPAEFRFETARFRIRQITVRPADPGADAVLGLDPIGVLQDSVTLNYNIVEPNVTELPLSTGTYVLEQLIINSINFRDDPHPCNDAPYPPPCDELDPPADALCACEQQQVTCAEYVDTYRSGEQGTASINNFGREVLINIQSGDDNVIHLVFDWGIFLEALQTSWACTQGFECGPGETWCLVEPFGFGFNEATFNGFAPDFLSIN